LILILITCGALCYLERAPNIKAERHPVKKLAEKFSALLHHSPQAVWRKRAIGTTASAAQQKLRKNTHRSGEITYRSNLLDRFQAYHAAISDFLQGNTTCSFIW